MIPKSTTPLTKLIRTGEGILVFAFNLATLIAPIVSSHVSPKTALIVAGVLNAVTLASRTLLKAVAVQKGFGIGAPTAPPVLDKVTQGVEALLPVADEVLADIAATEKTAVKVQATPGTPAEQVNTGLAPNPTTTGTSGAITGTSGSA